MADGVMADGVMAGGGREVGAESDFAAEYYLAAAMS